MRWRKSRDADARRTETPAVGTLDIGAVGTLLNFVQQIQGMQQKDALPDLRIYGHGRKRNAPEESLPLLAHSASRQPCPITAPSASTTTEDTWEGYAPYQPPLGDASETYPPRRDADPPPAGAVGHTPAPLIDIVEHTAPSLKSAVGHTAAPLRDAVVTQQDARQADEAALNILLSLKKRKDAKIASKKQPQVVKQPEPILDLMSTVGLREEVNVAHGPVAKAPGRPRSPIPWPFLFF